MSPEKVGVETLGPVTTPAKTPAITTKQRHHMSNGSTPLEPGATAPLPFNSEAIDVITSRSEYIRALANCVVCLSAGEKKADAFGGHMLIDIALPSVGFVIKEMAEQIEEASCELWERYRQAYAAANGGGFHS